MKVSVIEMMIFCYGMTFLLHRARDMPPRPRTTIWLVGQSMIVDGRTIRTYVRMYQAVCR